MRLDDKQSKNRRQHREVRANKIKKYKEAQRRQAALRNQK